MRPSDPLQRTSNYQYITPCAMLTLCRASPCWEIIHTAPHSLCQGVIE